MNKPCGCGEATRDRYASFIGLDCDGQAQRLIELLRPYLDSTNSGSPFWPWFAAKLNPASGPRHDALYLIHAHLNPLREQLEIVGHQAALALLEQIEVECC